MLDKDQKKIGIYLPDGVGIRNYIYSGLMDELTKQGKEIKFFHSIGAKLRDHLKTEVGDFFEVIELPKYKETQFLFLLRESICFARLNFNVKKTKNKTILTNYSIKGKIARKIGLYLAMFLGRILTIKYEWILAAEKRYNSYLENSELVKKLENSLKGISTIICLHQRSINAIPVFCAAARAGVKTATVIYSWDNLPKARLNIRADLYFVWSEWMKNELILFYPEIDVNKIVVSGSPQFSFYYKTPTEDEIKTFSNLYQIDKGAKYVCFSGNDKTSVPNDPFYLSELLTVVKQEFGNKNIKVIFRPCPGDDSQRYDYVIEKFDNVIKIEPDWVNLNNTFNGFLPKKNDIFLQRMIAHTCMGVVNIGSTMAFDFYLSNKAAAYVSYNEPGEKINKLDTNVCYNFEHLKTSNGLNPVKYLRTREDLKNWISSLLKNEWKEKEDMGKWYNVVNRDALNSNKIIATYL